jgi:hypothetical protein
MNIGFTGHRDGLTGDDELEFIELLYPGATWIHGGARGFDSQVHRVAIELGKVLDKTLFVIRPDYRLYPHNVAPIIRNEYIVDLADAMVACYDKRDYGGTHRTILYTKSRHKPLYFVSYRRIEVMK